MRERLFCVEGEKNLNELSRSAFEVKHWLFTDEYAKRFSGSVTENVSVVSQKTLESVGFFQSNRVGLAVVYMPDKPPQTEGRDFVLVLDGVADPGNLGTIIRTLDWFGRDLLVCSRDCADVYNPKTISSSMGSFTRVKVAYVDLEKYLARQENDVYGMVLDGEDLNRANPGAGVYVLGNESHGIRPELFPYINRRITIRGHGGAKSLNVAASNAILLDRIFNA